MKTLKKFIHILTVFMIMIGSVTSFTLYVDAYDFSISASSTNVNPGSTITISLNGQGLEGAFNVTVTNGAQVTGASPIWTGESTTVKAGSENFVVTVSPKSVTDSSNGSLITNNLRSKSISVTVKKPNTGGGDSGGGSNSKPQPPILPSKPEEDKRSSNNNLSSLTVSEGELSPAFNSDVTEYKLELKNTVEKINVSASASDSKSSVSGIGEVKLNPGENIITITVTAENGNPKIYKIKAIVDETPIVFIPYQDEQLGVVRNIANVPTLDGFKLTTIKIDDQQLNAWHHDVLSLTILYLQKGEEKNFYLFDEAKAIVTSIYKPVVINEHKLVLVDIPNEIQYRVGMKYQSVMLNDLACMGWTFDDPAFKNYVLIYAMDDKGIYHYYQYELTEKTLQIYSQAAAMTQGQLEALQKEKHQLQMITIVAIAMSVILLVGMIVALVKVNTYKKLWLRKRKNYDNVDTTIINEKVGK